MHRQITPEFMDELSVNPSELDRALRYIRGINRWLGGAAALIRHLEAWTRGWERGQELSLLDVGTGSADIPLEALRWARGRGIRLQVTGIDRHPGTLELAREHVIAATRDLDSSEVADAFTLVQLDASDLDQRFSPASFDYVHAGMFLHHLDDDHIVRVLRSMDRAARRGIVWNDLVRSRVGYGAIHLMTLGQPRIIRHDATVSVRAGFTRVEAMELGRSAGIDYCHYQWNLFTHRFTFAGEKVRDKDAARSELE